MSRFMILMLALALPALSFAQDKDAQEISRYVLTDAALAKYENALNKLRPLAGQVGSCEEEEEAGAQSIGEMAARMDRVPAVKAAIQSAGLTTREWVLFSFATLQTGMAVWAQEQGGALPPDVSRANADFYKKNRARIEGMKPLEDGCDDSSGEEEYPDE